MNLSNLNILSIDYGERYVGLALKKSSANIGFPLKIIDQKLNNLHDELDNKIKENEINLIVVGYPLGLNKQMNRMTAVVDEFIDSLTFNIPIEKIDERFTSNIVSKRNTERNDDLSALEILESFLKKNE
ncbi:MAG: RuvX/YqgF family protein [Actinomycetota bacterium]|nr:RuvX/YqgF family protein [Actinomycetota bacterium]MDA3013449.1 RuvX/YqgF family protein [Actinomycetota bacterium]